jgi:hypothetical protein
MRNKYEQKNHERYIVVWNFGLIYSYVRYMYEPINNFHVFFIQTLTECMNEITLNGIKILVIGYYYVIR